MKTFDVSQHEQELALIEQELASPGITAAASRFRELTRRHAHLAEIVQTSKALSLCLNAARESADIIDTEPDDRELLDLAREEYQRTTAEAELLEQKLTLLLLPQDPEDDANTIVEIRAGTGGEEASLFAADLYRMYSRYAEEHGWKVDPMNTSYAGLGGLKEIIFSVEGDCVYSRLKYEAGVHRVQRVPETEASGRIHTSAASVAVLPEAEDVAVDMNPHDLRIDVYRSTGPGGQSVNTTDSAVRITHEPTGLVVTCQDEKSQHKNKAKALRVLKARLLENARREAESARAEKRRSMVGSGDRSDKIRTYNFPQNRVTDHRIGLTVHALEEILNGNLDQIIAPLIEHDNAERLNHFFAHEK